MWKEVVGKVWALNGWNEGTSKSSSKCPWVYKTVWLLNILIIISWYSEYMGEKLAYNKLIFLNYISVVEGIFPNYLKPNNIYLTYNDFLCLNEEQKLQFLLMPFLDPQNVTNFQNLPDSMTCTGVFYVEISNSIFLTSNNVWCKLSFTLQFTTALHWHYNAGLKICLVRM